MTATRPRNNSLLTIDDFPGIRVARLLCLAIFLLVFVIGPRWSEAQLLRGRVNGVEGSGSASRKENKVASQLSGLTRPGDELWIVNTRSVDTGVCAQVDLDLGASVYERIDGQYCNRSASELLERINQDDVRQNVVFIHGNRTDVRWARLRGTETYETIMDVTQANCPTTCSYPLPPVRWIIWSWPTDIIRGPKRDLTIKSQRACGEGQLLAQFLQQVKRPQIGVLAYSLGAQALVSALCCWKPIQTQEEQGRLPQPLLLTPPHLEAVLEPGETVDPSVLETETVIDTAEPVRVMELAEEHAAELAVRHETNCTASACYGPRLRLVLVAAAVPSDWFHSQLGRDCMQNCAETLTLINNPRDRVLDVYRKITHRGPLGVETGFLQQSFPTMVHLVQNNALNNHILTEYFSGESTRQRIRSSLFQLGDYSELGATVTEAR